MELLEMRIEPAGVVVGLRRYPVKSMQGEEINEAALAERGILGDRAYAVQDRATGHIASAKHPRKWAGLLACRAAFVEPPRADGPLPPVRITLPGGAVVSSAQADVDQILSDALGRDVALIAEAPPQPTREADRAPVDAPAGQADIRQETMALAAPGTFFDYAVLHILTTATLDHLRAAYPAGRFEIRRFRPNLVVAPLDTAPGFVENGWLGRTLVIGDTIRLHVIDPSPRCIVTTLAQGELPHDPRILRTIAQHNEAASATLAPGVVLSAVAGVYASVYEGGMLRLGDIIRLL